MNIKTNTWFPDSKFHFDLEVFDDEESDFLIMSSCGQRGCSRCDSYGTIFSGTNDVLIPEPIGNKRFFDLSNQEKTKTGYHLDCPCRDKNLPDHEETYL